MAQSINLRPGKLTLYKRSRSARWQCRYKLGTGGWHRVSTGEDNLNEATDQAYRLFYASEERLRNNLPSNTRSFKHVAQYAIKRMQEELDYGTGKSIYRRYIKTLEQHLIPYFGRSQIDSITVAKLHSYAQWRDNAIAQKLYDQKHRSLCKRIKDIQKLRKELAALDANPPTYRPSQTVVNTHNAALSRVFDEALLHGWITESIRPTVLNKATPARARGSFEFEEYRKITDALKGRWREETSSEKGRRIRRVLREYVLILSNTGMRHGSEASNLRWRDVTFYTDARTRERYFEFEVNGKTGPRALIARDGVNKFLERLKNMDGELCDLTLDEVIEKRSEKYLFRDDKGTRVTSDQLRQAFRKLLDEKGLRTGKDGKNRSLYSLRHMYATRALIKGQNIYVLSVQMGTSVKMLEQHYSKLTARMRADELSGRVRKIEQSEET